MGSRKRKEGGLPSTASSSSALSMSETSEDLEPSTDDDMDFINPLNGMSAAAAGGDTASAQHHDGVKKTILTTGGFADALIPATYVAETNLPTDVGHFRIRAYRIEEFEDAMREPNPLGAGAGLGSEPCVIYCTDKPPFGPRDGERGGAKEVPVRIHDQCFTSEVFRSQRCVANVW